MADATNIKNLIIRTESGTYQLSAGSGGGSDEIYGELGITQERFAELLARDFYCPLMPEAPTDSTLTYTDTDGSVNHFAVGQECRVPEGESTEYVFYKFCGTYQGKAVWVTLGDSDTVINEVVRIVDGYKTELDASIGNMDDVLDEINDSDELAEASVLLDRINGED